MEDLLAGIQNIEVRLAPRFDAGLLAVDDPTLQASFLASFDMIAQIYADFRALISRPPFSEATEPQKERFRAAVATVDELYVKLCTMQGQFKERKETASNLTVQSHHGSHLSINSVGNPSRSNVRLPKISLPSFDGSLKSWPTFHDLFKTLIHANGSLSDIEKFQYLISSLSGEPLSLVKHLPLTADNYAIAYDSLVERYQNERALVSFYWKAIWSAPAASSDSERSLRALLNVFTENLVALEQFHNIDLWDFTLLSLFLQKMDNSTRKQFEIKYSGSTFPTFANARQFVLDQCRALEANSLNSPAPVVHSHSRAAPKPVHAARGSRALVSQTIGGQSSTSDARSACSHCRGGHQFSSCPSVLSLPPRERYDAARNAKLCINCLRPTHSVQQCPSAFTCRQCHQKHHTILHFPKTTPSSVQRPAAANFSGVLPSHVVESGHLSPSVSSNCAQSLAASANSVHVLLATALVHIRDRWGGYHRLRALIDPASQASFILDSSARQLGLTRSGHRVPVFGLGLTSPGTACGTVSCVVKAADSPPIPETEFIVLRSICGNLPDAPIDPREFQDSRIGNLADPNWFKPGPIQVLLGADLYPAIIRDGIVSRGSGHPLAMNTIFGWALLGPFRSPAKSRSSFLACTSVGLDDSLRRFWEVEEIPTSNKPRLSPDEQDAEICFRDTVYQCPSGRFGVALPFKGARPTFDHSQQIADRRWLAIERRLVNQDKLRELYVDFMRDYLDSGHMTLLDSEPRGSEVYYIPHHPVIKIEDGKSKIRVVFDASARASNHVSLNETLLVGPKLQQDLVALLLQFRCRPVVFTCDIRQMYRQVLITPNDRQFQLIRFRFTPNEPICTYQLNTITYGVSSAPFLAVRVLLHLAELHASDLPLAAEAINRNLYVDDLLCGADSIEAAKALRLELVELLKTGCFELRKWASNRPEVLHGVPVEHCRTQPSTFDEPTDSTVKILGLQWCAAVDAFSFTVAPSSAPCTKRSILSEVARIYDPLGFLSPISFFAKCMIQCLWKLGLDWDDPPPDSMCQDWRRCQSELPRLSSLQIPRHAFPTPTDKCQLHAFCDASEAGYAAVLYVRFLQHGVPTVRLLIAKSKVAPVKLLTVPRLELCAAVLLSNLVAFTVKALSGIIDFDEIFAWSDSMVVLGWLRSPSHRWKTFVAHRVEHVQQRVPSHCWRHVGTAENAADPASRGLFPEEILSCSLWWSGPPFLSLPSESWPDQVPASSPDTTSEERKLVMVARVPLPAPIDVEFLLARFSSLRKVQRTIAYCSRFILNYFRKPDKWRTESLSEVELHSALLFIVRQCQKRAFADEIRRIRSGQCCSKSFRKLAPFLDRDGTLRVGGRLKHCPELPFETRHPALLPSRHRLTELLVRQVHLRHAHPGLNNTCYLLQQKFWIISTRRSVRRYLSSCYRCFRIRPQAMAPVMGNLPAVRISQLKPFSCVGVDYGGPFPIVMSRGRGVRTTKAYICLFVCFATKALHVELASDLSADTFLAALRRFIARRGRCSTIFSDNGTNFVGANKQLCSFTKMAAESESITWRFNPPSSPHFGGIWESGIKSVKTHLSRVIGEQILTFEELSTLLAQIESLLNSRPLCSLSSDPNDLSSLTPGHFLTLEPLTAPPDPDLSHLSRGKLSRWQLVQNMHQRFWTRWRDEYLHTLYQRSKWHQSKGLDRTDIGTLVLIKDETAPPLKWRMGRISELYPGKDGVSRVADVRTVGGVMRRPLVKLCPLPVGH